MKTKLFMMTVGFSALALAGCETTSNTTANVNKVNSNTAVVTNANANVPMANTNTTNTRSNANVTREDYDKNRSEYERARRTGDTAGQGLSDGWILFKTRAALATTADIRESTINVDVTNDVITLKGTVENAAQKAKAEEVAKGIDGQKGVKNQLTVAPNDSMTNRVTGGGTNTSNANTNRK